MTHDDRETPEPIRYVCMPGSAYTGSTLLGFLMNAHPACASIGAATGLVSSVDTTTYRCSCDELFTECGFWREIGSRTAAAGHPVDVYRTNYWTTHFAPTGQPYLDALLIRSLRSQLLTAARDRLLGSFGPLRRRIEEIGATNRVFARSVLDLLGKSVFVDSSRDHLRPKLLASLPGFDVRVIHLIRDARANSASIRKHHPGRPIGDAARVWRRANLQADQGRRYVPESHWMTLRYDDLCSDTQGTLDRISDFLGVARAPLPGDFRSVENHIVGNEMRLGNLGQVREDVSWRERLTPADLEAVARVAGDVNRRFGFDWP